ncbi:MAG TPA: hypothetical protein DEA90_09535 [Opitutae bacterium]|nr:hypothetical protein [Puniceicoccaceae bacterium]HBR94391.1 hypothetical protein [Opitutae bacterium]|tara:strand:- start:6578 stop:8482 length:1905 start_codon:yes stop_codon:yes gene_type:complete
MRRIRLTGNCSVQTSECDPAIQLAVADLIRDLKKVLGGNPTQVKSGTATIRIGMALGLDSEAWRIRITDRVEIQGGGRLGLIFGIYAFTHRFLGVDPMWFWKGIEPKFKGELELSKCQIDSKPRAFKYRGWFINDEDLLGRWKDSGKQRFSRWPRRRSTEANPDYDFYEKRLLRYYSSIVDANVMSAVFEALLRMECNLVIPASFIDIMNPDEASIVEAAVVRGLYVSQHHVEPLGVSHFGFETWAQELDTSPSFSYRQFPDAMRQCWADYAKRWWEIAGEQIIWQVGLRGRGDRPLWDHDPEAKMRAGEFISGALSDQLEIIHSVESRGQPPATLTLWLEGADLIESGNLSVPDNVTLVFADDDLSQQMRSDFHLLNRSPGQTHGVYYHLAVWSFGAHLVQGASPDKIAKTMSEVLNKGDREYAILNVANVREHVLGISAWSELVSKSEPFNPDDFIHSWVPEGTAELYRSFFAAFPQLRHEWSLHDGCARTFISSLLKYYVDLEALPEIVRMYVVDQNERLRLLLSRAIKAFDGLIERASSLDLEPEDTHDFFQSNFVLQVKILRGLYGVLLELLPSDPDFEQAEEMMVAILEALPLGESGKWSQWYRGDTKVDLKYLQKRLVQAKTTCVVG